MFIRNPKEAETMTNPTCPDCHTTFPSSNSAGHCRSCHRTFIGGTSFDAHRMGDFPNNRYCDVLPYEYPGESGTRYGHWADDRGFLHYGRKLTTEDRAKLGWVTK